MSQQKSFARYVPAIVGGLIVLAVIVGMIWMVRGLKHKSEAPQRQVAQIVKIIRPPPPPEQPPPPPPPPDKVDEPLPEETPEEAPPEESQAAEQLGVDAEGVAGADGFGLAARPGGRDLIGSGGAIFGWYTSRLKDAILNSLSEDERIRKDRYQVTVRVWLGADGKVERIKLQSTTGDRSLDDAIEAGLRRLDRMDEAPPLEMPQPVTLRIVSR